MKLIKILAFALLFILAFKVAVMLLGLASAFLVIAFWLAVFYVIGKIIWYLIKGDSHSNLTFNRELKGLEQTASSMKSHLREFKRQVTAK